MKSMLITGDRSGCGKTSITLALAALLSEEYDVQTFKVGMDYIDPSYHTGVTGRPCRNLDSFVMSNEEIEAIYRHGCTGAEIAMVEGVRGLYEGAEALDDTGSTADIAKKLDLNVILVVNAHSITRSAAAIVKGFMAFDPGVKIRGVILNQLKGESHRNKAVTAIEHNCGVPVIGTIPRSDEMHLTMRHLGLIPYLEGKGKNAFLEKIRNITSIIGDHVDIDRLLECAGTGAPPAADISIFSPADQDVRIAVAIDEAFNFYYSDLFEIFPAFGAEIVPFSPIHDRLPDADGYIFGGGYPELFAGELEKNAAMREAIREVSLNGTPIYAECGGLLYLTDRIVLKEGWNKLEQDLSFEMCNVFRGETIMPAKRVVGYVKGSSRAESPMGAGTFRGHEFHHTDVRLDPSVRYAYQLDRGIGIQAQWDGALVHQTQGSYTHLHPVSSRTMMRHFVERCRSRS